MKETKITANTMAQEINDSIIQEERIEIYQY